MQPIESIHQKQSTTVLEIVQVFLFQLLWLSQYLFTEFISICPEVSMFWILLQKAHSTFESVCKSSWVCCFVIIDCFPLILTRSQLY
jgi:hypothetical protein